MTSAHIEIGRTLARKVFAKRGDHTEAHISELELAALLALAAKQGAQAAYAEGGR